MNAEKFYLEKTGWENLDYIEEFNTPIEAIGLLESFKKHLKTDEMIGILHAVRDKFIDLKYDNKLLELDEIQKEIDDLIKEATSV